MIYGVRFGEDPENRQKTAAKTIECIKNNPYINRIELSELCDISQDALNGN